MDINKAEAMGMFGPDPVLVWHDAEWQALVDSLCAGLVFSEDPWDDIEHCKNTCSDVTTSRNRAPRMHRDNLRILKDKVENPDKYNEFIRQQPPFEACEVLSETSTVPPVDGCGEDAEELRIFEELSNAAWNGGHRARITEIAKKSKSVRTKNANLGGRRA